MTCHRLSIRALRSHALLVALLGTAALWPAGASAQADYPNKPVMLVTAFAPGSGPDATLRMVADKLGKLWAQRVQVENRPGGGGFIAMDAVKRAAPDGYTLLQLDSDHLAAVPQLYKQKGVEALKSFEPVASIFRTTFLVAVATDSPFKSMADIVPTAAQAGGPADFDVNAFVVLVAPKGLPVAVRNKVNTDMAKVLADPEVKARFDTFAFEPISGSADEITRAAEVKSKVYEQLVKKANISLE